MKIVLIRHFKTQGNLEKRYIGRTDEPILDPTSIDLSKYPKTEMLISSPMLRCIQTSERIYQKYPDQVVRSLREKDFGAYEGKNFEELKDDPAYQKWLLSNGTLPFPEGEADDAFQKRTIEGFEQCISECIQKEVQTVGFVVHGGTIMSILSAYAEGSHTFYDWQVENGNGFQAKIEEEAWKTGKKTITEIKKLW